jgi:hypothetical protein
VGVGVPVNSTSAKRSYGSTELVVDLEEDPAARPSVVGMLK